MIKFIKMKTKQSYGFSTILTNKISFELVISNNIISAILLHAVAELHVDWIVV